ncbi:FixH family protein [Paraperlucidibaca wandonensis]|jgi:hypothetical protein|uniref:FixH family protein n=1 Tax=Paraperlucidibaca wandonensis TaxID=1268273 RepID=A0ABW3HHB3_9GAMM|nr:FixH family protein [Paraperlucidibaca sp.]MBQ0723424.1 FixH family protein [Paraperlucidibaca sp.]MBQ0842194.1 FixH family protein [Paraperlucidibaca sp.]|tara:strand:+ start:316 stop:813 length:498 start_codon:yes stop_codon:yes gene_type:complete
MSTTAQRPWYRQFWVWFIIVLPFISIMGSLYFVYTAVVNRDDVVSGDWYQDGKSINEDFARVDVARELNMHANIILDDISGEVLVSMQGNKDVQWPASLKLNLYHVTQKVRDQTLNLTAVSPGEYRGQLAKAPVGFYTLDLSTSDWHMSKDINLPADGNIDLSAQ